MDGATPERSWRVLSSSAWVRRRMMTGPGLWCDESTYVPPDVRQFGRMNAEVAGFLMATGSISGRWRDRCDGLLADLQIRKSSDFVLAEVGDI